MQVVRITLPYFPIFSLGHKNLICICLTFCVNRQMWQVGGGLPNLPMLSCWLNECSLGKWEVRHFTFPQLTSASALCWLKAGVPSLCLVTRLLAWPALASREGWMEYNQPYASQSYYVSPTQEANISEKLPPCPLLSLSLLVFAHASNAHFMVLRSLWLFSEARLHP